MGSGLISLGCIANEVGPQIDLSDLHSFRFFNVHMFANQILERKKKKKIFGLLGSLVKSCLSVLIYADLRLFSLKNTVFNEWINTIS